jgi:hypothetical protein
MSDWFDDGSDEYEEEKAAKNARIEEGATSQLNALTDDLNYLTSDDNMFTDRMDGIDQKHKFSEVESTTQKDATIAQLTNKAVGDMDKIEEVTNVSGFEGSGIAETNREDLANTLTTQGSIADTKKQTADEASLIKRDDNLAGVEADWYKALRMLQSEMLSIETTAEGSTGDQLGYEMPDWDDIFGDDNA